MTWMSEQMRKPIGGMGVTAKVKLADGPCQLDFSDRVIQRCPTYIRAAVGPDGNVVLLDRTTDEPTPDQAIYVYQLTEMVLARQGRRATYEFVQADPQGRLRTRRQWMTWAMQRARTVGIR